MSKDLLQGNFKKNLSKFKVGAAAFIVTLILKIIVSAVSDTVIVYAGIRLFKTISMLTTALLVIAAAAFLIFLAMTCISYFSLKKEEAIEEADSNKGPVLKVKGNLDPVQIRNSLISEGDKWIASISQMNPGEVGEMNVALTSVRETMVQMDDYQLRLKNLLDSNGADALRDTEEILDKVEQHICRNVRKLLNIMTVSSPNTQNDIDVVELTAKNCAEDNNRLLKTTKEFIVSVTEFLNSQGDSGSGINEVEVYKNALTSQIEEGGIYS